LDHALACIFSLVISNYFSYVNLMVHFIAHLG